MGQRPACEALPIVGRPAHGYDKVIPHEGGMAHVEKRTFSLPAAHVTFIDEQVASGSYASASEVVRAGLRALQERDAAVERWLRKRSRQCTTRCRRIRPVDGPWRMCSVRFALGTLGRSRTVREVALASGPNGATCAATFARGSESSASNGAWPWRSSSMNTP